MRLPGPLLQAAFVDRPNRFVVVADLPEGTGPGPAPDPGTGAADRAGGSATATDGRAGRWRVRAHCPNPGRLTEFLEAGTPFLLRRVGAAGGPSAGGRKTAFDVVAARHRGTWVVLDTRLANDLVAEALDEGRLDEAFPGLRDVRREPSHGDGRLDFELATDDGPVLVEVKSVTLLDEADGETGLFPDAPTARGTRHLGDLAKAARAGRNAAVVFVAMRGDVRRIRPHRARDPAFAKALVGAERAGVEVLGYGTAFAVDPAGPDPSDAADPIVDAPSARFRLAGPVPVAVDAG